MLDKDKQFRGLDVSVEMIEPQLDDPVISKLVKEYDKLISMADKYSKKLTTPLSFFKNKETKAVLETIDGIIKDRFGLNVQHINGNGSGYAIIPVPPVNFNTIAGDVESRFDLFKSELGKGCAEGDPYCVPEVTEKTAKAKKYVKDVFKDETSVIYHTYVSHLKLEETLKSKGVKVNLQKAKFENLPKDYNVFVIADFAMMINLYKLTSRELTAVLLHEVGHGFTHLEYSYRTVLNTSSIVDSIRRDLAKGKSVGEVLNLVYNKELGGDEDLTKRNNSIAAIKVIDKYMDLTLNMTKNDRHSATDSEQLADQFAGRFGLGVELISGLNKMHEHYVIPASPMTAVLLSIINIVVVILSLVIMPALIPYFVGYISLVLVFGGEDSNATTYDKKIRRYKRIKNEMVRLIRTTNLDKKAIKSILLELKSIDGIIEKASSDTTILDKISDNFFPWNKRVSSFQKLEELLEDMSENDLYIASSKLKNI